MNAATADLCSICGLTSSGYHFGALSCPACNAFFRRSIADARRYLCHRSGRCTVAQGGKWYCRACRLKKCIECGMDPKAVQPQRDVNGQKRKHTNSGHRGNAKCSQMRLEKSNGDSIRDTGRQTALDKSMKKGKTTDKRFTIENIIATSKRTSSTVLSDSGFTDRSNEIASSMPASRRIKTRLFTANGNVSGPLKEDDSFSRDNDHNSQSEMEQPANNSNLLQKPLSSNFGSQPSTSSRVTHKPAYDASKNKIEILLRVYSRLREMRRLLFNHGDLRELLDGKELPLYDCRRPVVHISGKVDLGLVIDFLNNFDAFSKLRLEDRVLLIKNGVVRYFTLERHYITMRNGGLHPRRLINFDGSYYDLVAWEKEMRDKEETTDKGVDKKAKLVGKGPDYGTIQKLFLPGFKETLNDLGCALYHSGATDVELVALIFLLFLDHKAANLSGSAKRILKEARDDMFRDWCAYYEAHNIPDGVLKIGNALFVLPEVYIATERFYDNYYMTKLFDLFQFPPVVKEATDR